MNEIKRETFLREFADQTDALVVRYFGKQVDFTAIFNLDSNLSLIGSVPTDVQSQMMASAFLALKDGSLTPLNDKPVEQ